MCNPAGCLQPLICYATGLEDRSLVLHTIEDCELAACKPLVNLAFIVDTGLCDLVFTFPAGMSCMQFICTQLLHASFPAHIACMELHMQSPMFFYLPCCAVSCPCACCHLPNCAVLCLYVISGLHVLLSPENIPVNRDQLVVACRKLALGLRLL